MNRAKAFVDLAYTTLAIALILYTVRGEVRRIVAEKRAEIVEHRSKLDERERRRKARRGYVAFLRERGIEPTIDELEGATADA